MIDIVTFTVTDHHLMLLPRMCMGWCHDEFGAPEVDPKRPYGNGDVIYDIREIIGDDKGVCPECHTSVNPIFSDDYCRRLHKDMETVLQILVQFSYEGITAGEYMKADPYSREWSRVE